jgi:hypothetical protein
MTQSKTALIVGDLVPPDGTIAVMSHSDRSPRLLSMREAYSYQSGGET